MDVYNSEKLETIKCLMIRIIKLYYIITYIIIMHPMQALKIFCGYVHLDFH